MAQPPLSTMSEEGMHRGNTCSFKYVCWRLRPPMKWTGRDGGISCGRCTCGSPAQHRWSRTRSRKVRCSRCRHDAAKVVQHYFARAKSVKTFPSDRVRNRMPSSADLNACFRRTEKMLKSVGASTQPCFTPLFMPNASDMLPSYCTLPRVPS